MTGDAWYWVLFDGFLAVIAGIGVMFGVAIAAYLVYRAAILIGIGAMVLVGLMFGERDVDGVPYYDEEDYP